MNCVFYWSPQCCPHIPILPTYPSELGSFAKPGTSHLTEYRIPTTLHMATIETASVRAAPENYKNNSG